MHRRKIKPRWGKGNAVNASLSNKIKHFFDETQKMKDLNFKKASKLIRAPRKLSFFTKALVEFENLNILLEKLLKLHLKKRFKHFKSQKKLS